MMHQFDEDENADLKIDTDDMVLQAAVRIINRFGGWDELTLADDPHFLEAIEIAQYIVQEKGAW
jgi:hypothetical protein